MKKLTVFLCVLVALISVFTFSACKDENVRSTYQIDLSLEQNELSGSMRVNFVNNSENALDHLKFNLYANAFRKDALISPVLDQHKLSAYPNGLSYGQMQIEKVYGDSGALEYLVCGQDQNVLEVKLNGEVFPQESVVVTIDYTLTLANVIARTGYNDKTINLANFYPVLCALDQNGFYECVYSPIGDPYYSDCADYNVKLKFDKDYKVACSGEIVSSEQNSIAFAIKNARSAVMVLSQDFNVESTTVNGVLVNYYYYDDAEPQKSMDFAKKSLTLFSQKFGKYPYSTYSVVQTKFVQGGMEFPSLVMISDALKGLPYGEVIVHETAHQWWQSTVGNNECEYGFLDEGLAEYSVVIFYENFSEYGYTKKALMQASEDTFNTFCTVSDKLFGKVNTSMIRNLKDFSSEYEYVNIAYIKPCIMYDTLRQTIGDKRFFDALQRYYKDYSFLNATPYDLVGAFEKTGADSNGFFISFFEGKEVI